MKSTALELLVIASVLLIVLLGSLIPMAIRRRRNGGKGNTLFTVLGIIAALDLMLLGVLIPKALLEREEDKYLAVEWTQDSGGSSAIEPRTTAAPLPGEGHEIDLVWLWEALALIQDENELSLREPLSFEMSMEQAAQTARNELDLLSALGALTVVSLAFIAVRRETYKLCFSRIFDKKSKLFFSYEAILLAAAALFIAVTSILF